MLNGLKLSVIIPTYNRPDRLSKSLSCYLKNQRQDIEFIIMDNASPSDIGSVVSSAAHGDTRVVYHRNPQNIGFSRNLFHGFMHAKAPYIMVMPDDDYVTQGFFDLIIQAFENNPQLGVVHSYLDPAEREFVVKSKGDGLEIYAPGTEALAKAFMPSGGVPGIAFRQNAIDYKEWLLDGTIYPQIRITVHALLKWAVGFVHSSKEYISLGGLEDNVVIRATDAMNRPADYGVVERMEIISSTRKYLSTSKWREFYLHSGANLILWAASVWQSMEQLEPKYARRMIKALMANKQLRAHPAFWYALLQQPNVWRYAYGLLHFPRVLIMPLFWKNFLFSLQKLPLIWRRKK
jgi:glycosyltransferase involved in cell wall biosynthesis